MNGNKSDNAHPPIYPLKPMEASGVEDRAKKLYDLIVEHFLAQCSKDAKGEETEVQLEVGGNLFTAGGTVVTQRNFLEIFYLPFGTKQLPEFTEGEKIEIESVELLPGQTSSPNHLTEADLLTKMNRSGIGTDAT